MTARLAFAAALAVAALPMAAAAEEVASREAALAQCVWEKDPDLARAIRDAESEEAFVAAFRRAVALCEAPQEEYSLGLFFDALNALLRGESGE